MQERLAAQRRQTLRCAPLLHLPCWAAKKAQQRQVQAEIKKGIPREAVASAAASAKQLYSVARAAKDVDAGDSHSIQQQQPQQKGMPLSLPHRSRAAAETSRKETGASARVKAFARHVTRELLLLREVMEGSNEAALIAALFSPTWGTSQEQLMLQLQHAESWGLAPVPRSFADCKALLWRDSSVAVSMLPATEEAACAAGSANEQRSSAAGSSLLPPADVCSAFAHSLLQTKGLTAAD
ncbi:hypothetical protein cyc_09138, partial [Cyclospora cayetanensis]